MSAAYQMYVDRTPNVRLQAMCLDAFVNQVLLETQPWDVHNSSCVQLKNNAQLECFVVLVSAHLHANLQGSVWIIKSVLEEPVHPSARTPLSAPFFTVVRMGSVSRNPDAPLI